MKNMFFSYKQMRGSHETKSFESNNNDIEKCLES